MNEKLLEALKVIREECTNHDNCRDCLLHDPKNAQICVFKGLNPEDWKLYGDEVEPTSLFLL